ncbi:triple gene block protein 3 [Cherry robigovirus 5]|nr:triple gene block protein 3 [Cherry robigovirus 5]
MLALNVLSGIAAFIITIVIFTLCSSKPTCVVVVSGESARVVGCEITKELSELVKNLKPYAHGLGWRPEF